MKKKGQLNLLTTGVMTVFLVIVVIVIGIQITNQFKNVAKTQSVDSVQIVNETIAAGLVSNKTGTMLTYRPLTTTTIVVTNATGAVTKVLLADNYSVNTSGQFILVGVGSDGFQDWNASALNVTYSYDRYRDPVTALNSSEASLTGFVDWLPIIVVVIAAAVILGLIVRSFVGRRKE